MKLIDCRKCKYMEKESRKYYISDEDYREYYDEYCVMIPINFSQEEYLRYCEYYEPRE